MNDINVQTDSTHSFAAIRSLIRSHAERRRKRDLSLLTKVDGNPNVRPHDCFEILVLRDGVLTCTHCGARYLESEGSL